MPPSAVVITLSGFTMGGLTDGSVGVTVHTSTDLLPSAAVYSGSIGGIAARLASCRNGCCRVEVLYMDSWGTICDDGFDDKEARVVCRNLGYSSGTARASFGGGSGTIWLDDVSCPTDFTGFIGDCSHGGWGRNNCDHSEDVGVCCS